MVFSEAGYLQDYGVISLYPAWGAIFMSGFLTSGLPTRTNSPTESVEAVSSSLVKFVASCESFRGTAYNDTNGNCTIGYGHLMHMGPCTAEDLADGAIDRGTATTMLQQDLRTAEAAVNRNITVPLNQNQFDALASFTFNVGGGKLRGSTLRSVLNSGHYDEVGSEMQRWSHGGTGLAARRANEAAMFNTGTYNACYSTN
jgi:lysozyme